MEVVMIIDKKMQVFLTVAENCSFSKAARHLSMSQSVVSFHVVSLERELGVSLFERKGRTINLTREGDILYKQGRRIALEARKLEDEFSNHSKRMAQRVYLGSDAVTCSFTLPPLLKEFRTLHPDYAFSYQHCDQEAMIDLLIEGELDICLAGHSVRHKKLTSHTFYHDSIILVGHPDKKSRTISIDDISGLELLWLSCDLGLDKAVRKKMRDTGIMLKDLNIMMDVDELSLLKNFLKAGTAMAFLPRITVEEELRYGCLVEIPVDGLTITRQTFLLHLKDKTLRDSVRTFQKYVSSYRNIPGK